MPLKNPFLAAGLSLLPGAGHLYAGKRNKGLALLCIDACILMSLLFARSALWVLIAGGLYLVTVVPAIAECYLMARTGRTDGVFGPKGYVVFMLLVTGFGALPLLWQDDRFGRRTKIAWTVAVPVLAVVYIGSLVIWSPQLEKWLGSS